MEILLQISRIGLILGGLLWAITSVFHPNNNDEDALQNRYWKPALGWQAVSYLCLLVGVVGLHLRQAEVVAVPGLVGFLLALVGAAICFTININFVFVLPAAAAQVTGSKAPNVLVGPSGPQSLKWLALLTFSYLFTFVPGYILIGITTINAAVLPALTGWLLVAGMLVSNIGVLGKGIFILRRVGGVIFGVGLVWLGLALL